MATDLTNSEKNIEKKIGRAKSDDIIRTTRNGLRLDIRLWILLAPNHLVYCVVHMIHTLFIILSRKSFHLP